MKAGFFVCSNDILVGKLTTRAFTPQSKIDEKVIRAIFGDQFIDFHKTFLRLPANSEGIRIEIEKYMPQSSVSIMQNVTNVVKVYVAHRAISDVGDKICGIFGNKTVKPKIFQNASYLFFLMDKE